MNGPRTRPTNYELKHVRCPKCRAGIEAIENGYKCKACKWTVKSEALGTTFPQRAWMWLDFKKVYIGGAVTAIGSIVQKFEPALGTLLTVLGGALAGVGIGHKAIKGYETVKGESGKWWEIVLKILLEILKQFKKVR